MVFIALRLDQALNVLEAWGEPCELLSYIRVHLTHRCFLELLPGEHHNQITTAKDRLSQVAKSQQLRVTCFRDEAHSSTKEAALTLLPGDASAQQFLLLLTNPDANCLPSDAPRNRPTSAYADEITHLFHELNQPLFAIQNFAFASRQILATLHKHVELPALAEADCHLAEITQQIERSKRITSMIRRIVNDGMAPTGDYTSCAH